MTALVGRNGWFSLVLGWHKSDDIPPGLYEPILRFVPTKNQAEPAVSADQSSRTGFWSFWAIFGRPWAKIGVGPNLKIGSYSPGGMSLDLCHPRTKLNQPLRPTRAVEPVLGHFGLFLDARGPKLGMPQISKLLAHGTYKPNIPSDIQNVTI